MKIEKIKETGIVGEFKIKFSNIKNIKEHDLAKKKLEKLLITLLGNNK